MAFSTTYYVDNQNGNDASAGTATGAGAWKTLTKVNGMTFGGGDSLLFSCGGAWIGMLQPKGSGTSGHPLVISKYGTGNLPLINGGGGAAAISFSNQEYFELCFLEVTNIGTPHQTDRKGVMIVYSAFGKTIHHVFIHDMFIHNVDGNSAGGGYVFWESGGIWIHKSGTAGEKFDSLVIERNRIVHVYGIGILYYYGSGGDPNATRSRNVFIRNNVEDSIGGDGIVIHTTNGGIVEHNVLHCGGLENNGCCAGMWGGSWNDSAYFQFNEVYEFLQGGGCDRQSFDSDFNEQHQFCQYNYSHDNYGGFFLTVPSCHGTTIRYNISQNDGRWRIFCFNSDWPNQGAEIDGSEMIYNNVFYIPSGKSEVLIGDRHTPANFYNNIVINNGNIGIPVIGKNNCFYGNISGGSGAAVDSNIRSDPMLVGVPATAVVGRTNATGFKLKAGSPCIGKGKRLIGMGSQDYYGNPLPATGTIDIGVHQYQNQVAALPHRLVSEAFSAAAIERGDFGACIRLAAGSAARIVSPSGAIIRTLRGQHDSGFIINARTIGCGIYLIEVRTGRECRVMPVVVQ
jgi:hypothetical protein